MTFGICRVRIVRNIPLVISGPFCAARDKLWFPNELFLPPFQGLEILWTVDPGRRSQTRFALGYYLSGFQPLSLERQVEFFSPSWPSLENILPELKTVLPNADLIAFLLLPPWLNQHESHRHCSRVVPWCGLANSSCLC